MYYLKHKPKHIEFSNIDTKSISEKIEKGIDDIWSNLKEKRNAKNIEILKRHPLNQYLLTGGLVGAGVGSISNLLLNKNKKKSNVRKLVEGGLLGGLTGLGTGLYVRGSSIYRDMVKDLEDK